MSESYIYAPEVPQPTAPGDIVGLILQNTGASATPAQPLTFGEVFKPGAVAPNSNLVMQIGGQDLPVQMDATTFSSDGSVAVATLTAMAPTLAPDSSAGAMLAVASSGAAGAAVDLASALGNYNLSVNLTMAGEGSQSVDAVAALEAALKNGTAQIIRSGPLASEASVRIPLSGSFYLTADITAFGNGTFSSDVTFNNDATALGGPYVPADYDGPTSIDGGTVAYSESIVQNGQTVSQENNITQYQYQNWHAVVGTSGPTSQVNIQHDLAYLEEAGAVPNFDPSVGVSQTLLNHETATMTDPTWVYRGAASGAPPEEWDAPLAPNGIDQFMNDVGGRGDIGITTAWNAAWLMSQNATTAQFALAQSNTAGAVPWNFFNPNTGNYYTTEDAANIWTDPGDTYGTSYLVPAPDNGSAGNGWTPDTTHDPDLSYVPYLMTGSQFNLNELNAQAAYSETAYWPSPGYANGEQQARSNGEGLLGTEMQQTRAVAWSMREVDEAASVDPPGSAMQQYFQNMENVNYQWMVQQLPTWTAEEGSSYGWFVGDVGRSGIIAPWQQDYLAGVIGQAALQGNQDAKTVLGWMSHFLVGRFLNGANGFNPRDGVAYHIYVEPTQGYYNIAPGGDAVASNWAQIEADTQANSSSNGDGWAASQGDYAALAAESLADVISVFESPDAINAYGWLEGSGAPGLDPVSMAQWPDYDVVPRLSDGNLLTKSNQIYSQDAAGTSNTITGTDADQLIEAGAGNDTVLGGTGINILFGGSGSDALVGGANSDYLYGGSGSDTLSAGAGTNYLDAGTGATTFLFSTGDQAANTLDGFRPGTDHLDVTDGSGQLVSGTALQAILGAATSDGSGGTVLHLSPTSTLTLTGVAPSDLTLGIFGTTPPSGIPSSGQGAGTGTGQSKTMTLSTSGNDVTGGDGLFTVTDNAGGNTVSGGSGGLDLTQTAGADVVNTAANANDTLNLTGGDTVSAAGNDTIAATGPADVAAAGGSLIFMGGAGTSTITGGSGSASITGGTGGVSVTGGTGSMVITNGGAADTIAAGAGNVTLKGGAGTLRYTGGSGTANIDEGSGGTMVTFGSGDATVAAGSGSNMFLFDGNQGAGKVVINGFKYGADSLNYQSFSGDPVASYVWGSAAETLNLADGTKVTLNFATS